ncbi:DUF1405 domain-containing protein [Salirhabdus salicampi]|uniref:DUF1405 domain-containing protein n=1 Tax=Salirhabdus salicampi TaxID=476102 RepID=UPI0020C5728F|nr:DUF1405 domain-containing protein [Salirhabdus salicampi]MCP8616686.1 DUF1405 domain-containing protein [Salirhabdus salicampi]
MYRMLLMDKRVLTLLMIINIAGTVYGYYWYRFQLADTPTKFLLFVPDSPTASLFFVFVLIAFIVGRNVPYIEALAMLTLFKYGVWAVVMNVLTLIEAGSIGFAGFMLIVSHGAMAVQGFMYSPFYRIEMRHLFVAAIWTLHNDVIDYVFEMMPVYYHLANYMKQIGYFTFWLSILSIALVYVFGVKRIKQ